MQGLSAVQQNLVRSVTSMQAGSLSDSETRTSFGSSSCTPRSLASAIMAAASW